MNTETRKFEVEEVTEVPTPPRAKVEDAVEEPTPLVTQLATPSDNLGETAAEKLTRKRDYLDGFLAEKPADAPSGEPGGATYEAIVTALREIYDPEIPVNIYDLGLIYGVDVSADGHAAVTMTLTTPNCPVAESMPTEVEMRVATVPGVREAEVNLVWDPPWDPAKMSDDAKLELGML